MKSRERNVQSHAPACSALRMVSQCHPAKLQEHRVARVLSTVWESMFQRPASMIQNGSKLKASSNAIYAEEMDHWQACFKPYQICTLGFVGVESLGFGVLGLMDLRVMSLKGVYRTSGSV